MITPATAENGGNICKGANTLQGRKKEYLPWRKIPLTDVKIESGEYKAVTDKKGAYKIAAIAAGDYTFTITPPGSAPVQEKITIKGGTRKSFSYTYNGVLAFEMEKNELKVVAALNNWEVLICIKTISVRAVVFLFGCGCGILLHRSYGSASKTIEEPAIIISPLQNFIILKSLINFGASYRI